MSLILKTLMNSVAQWKDVSPYAKHMDQPTAARQPTIHTTSPWGPSQYKFDGAADPNADSFYVLDTWFRLIDAVPVTAGTLMVWFTPDIFTTEMFLAGASVAAADDDEFWLGMDGTVANDPLEVVLRVNGITTYQGRFAASLTNADKNFAAITSDGTTIRAYFNGDPVALTDIVGANTGQWFASATQSNIFCVGALSRAVQTFPFNGKMALAVMYDNPKPAGEIKRIWESGYTLHGPRYLPKE